MSRLFRVVLFVTLMSTIFTAGAESHAKETLEEQLKQYAPEELAKRAHIFGDARRGAIQFFQSSLSCTQCHTAGDGAKLLGPDLSEMRERSNYQHIIDSLLNPSKSVREGYVTERILLSDGSVLVGMVKAESEDQLTIMVPGQDHWQTVAMDEIDARSKAGSIMPSGLVNQLDDEVEFFDLVCYLVELGQAGPEGAAKLKPDPSLLRPEPLPAYESDLDHRGMILGWNRKSMQRGQEIYNGLCKNCHGTVNEAGSLPNALRFASGKFRSGFDPLTIYKTLTHGYKMMLPQRQLVPQEKYDVIHYIREHYLKPNNPSQYAAIDDVYLASLPKGKLRGPQAVRQQPWQDMDYGPFLTHTYEIVRQNSPGRPGVTEEDRAQGKREGRPAERKWPSETNFAYKGIAIQLDSTDDPAGDIARGSHWIAMEHDTMRLAGAWSSEAPPQARRQRRFIDWEGILLDGKHWRSPRLVGELHFENLPGPGWANPDTGSLEDTRDRARDGQCYGPFPDDWLDYKGLYKHANRVVLSYSVGDAPVLESHRIRVDDDSTDWIRVLNVGESSNDLAVRIAAADTVGVTINGPDEIKIDTLEGFIVARIPANQTPVNFELHIRSPGGDAPPPPQTAPEDLTPFLGGGPAQWPQTLVTQSAVGQNHGAFAVDELTRPIKNPWKSRLRMSGLDFLPDGNSLIACCCDGDVWRIDGLTDPTGELSWRRIASGLFHPLGLKWVDGRVFVGCRDQIVVLNDLNGDGETDFYECFNHDHQVTEHFHEFAMGLQADEEGNLYYAKSARHAQDSLVEQHGTLLKVSADGSQTSIIANGFRAANGVCINPDGSFFVTDQEGHWTPMNRINRVETGGFYGNMYSYGAPSDSSNDAMEQPLCWPNKPFDRSPSELLWVDSKKWGRLNGKLLSLSYGYGKIFVVPHENVNGQWQGGMCRLPLPPFETGIMRARFHPQDDQLYACGMNAWGSSQTASPGGLYRIRATGNPMHLPAEINARVDGLTLTFTDPIDPTTAADPENYLVECWDLLRSANYGSRRHNERSLEVVEAKLSADGMSVELIIPEIDPTWTMQVAYKLKGINGDSFQRTLQNTIHQLSPSNTK